MILGVRPSFSLLLLLSSSFSSSSFLCCFFHHVCQRGLHRESFGCGEEVADVGRRKAGWRVRVGMAASRIEAVSGVCPPAGVEVRSGSCLFSSKANTK